MVNCYDFIYNLQPNITFLYCVLSRYTFLPNPKSGFGSDTFNTDPVPAISYGSDRIGILIPACKCTGTVLRKLIEIFININSFIFPS